MPESPPYRKAFDQLIKMLGWAQVDEDQQRTIAAPIESGMVKGKNRFPFRNCAPNATLVNLGSVQPSQMFIASSRANGSSR